MSKLIYEKLTKTIQDGTSELDYDNLVSEYPELIEFMIEHAPESSVEMLEELKKNGVKIKSK